MAAKQQKHKKQNKISGKRITKITEHNTLFLCLRHHIQAFLSSIQQLLKTPITSFITIIVISTAIIFPTALYIALKNLQQLTSHLKTTAQITIYLKKEVANSRITELVQNLKQTPEILTIEHISPEQGLRDLAHQSDLSHIMHELQENPLPHVLIIKPSLTSEVTINELAARLKQLPEVATLQVDALWIKRLFTLLKLANRIIYSLAGLLGIGILFIIGNTIHAASQTYLNEIEIYRLIGADNAFIRRPFLYFGTILGLMGGLMTLLILGMLSLWLSKPLQQFTVTYAANCQISVFDGRILLILIGITGALGWFAAWVAFQRQINT
jgi:cell division transport system permease protein